METIGNARHAVRESGKRRGRQPTNRITPPQRRTLEVIESLIEKKGFPPTVKDLAEVLGITPASVHDQLKQLTRKGYIKREPRKARSIVICPEAIRAGIGVFKE